MTSAVIAVSSLQLGVGAAFLASAQTLLDETQRRAHGVQASVQCLHRLRASFDKRDKPLHRVVFSVDEVAISSMVNARQGLLECLTWWESLHGTCSRASALCKTGKEFRRRTFAFSFGILRTPVEASSLVGCV